MLFIGESGGHEEDETGRAFCGKTGQELDRFYLPMAALRRQEVRVTNLIPVHPVLNRNPTADEIKFFEPMLLQEIEACKPEFIVPLGAFATKYFLGGHRDLHTVHGIPHVSKKFPTITILPSYHPAAGLHSSDQQPLIVYDFQQVQLALEGRLPERAADPFPNPIYIELTTAQEVFSALEGCDSVLMGQDTEGYAGTPWGLSFSIAEGVAYVIRIQSKDAIAAFDKWLHAHPEVVVILHNALHDLPILREMGVRILNFEDTMVLAYVLCLEPQGLKDLAYRHCGMKMKSYDEVVGPAVRKMTADYLLKVSAQDWGLDPPVPESEAGKEIKWRQPQALHKRALKAVNDIYGMYSGTIIGPKRGGSAELDEIGVRVGKVDHDTVERLGLRTETRTVKINRKTGLETEIIKCVQELNAWFAEVPVPIMPKLDEHFGKFVWELADPVPPPADDQPDPVKRWEAMSDELEESVARAEAVLGTLPETGLDALEDQQVAINYSCLDNTSLVETEYGMVKIGDLVRNRYTGRVWSYDATIKSRVLKPVVGWYRNANRRGNYIEWFSIQSKHGLVSERWATHGTRYTSDHKILTLGGWTRVDELTSDDRVAMPIRALTALEKSVIVGSLLGDADLHRRNTGGYACFRTTHCEKQRDYLHWKFSLLGDLTSDAETVIPGGDVVIFDKRSVRQTHYSKTTRMHPELSDLQCDVYAGGRKCVSDWCASLDWLGLALWYQDDGTLVNAKSVRLYTLGFTLDDIQNLKRVLATNFGLAAGHYRISGREQYAMTLNREQSVTFFAGIAGYVHPSMQYKLPDEFKGRFMSPQPIAEFTPFYSKVVRVYANPQKKSHRGSFCTSYCIDVADTHNFFTQNEIVHNCRDAHATVAIRNKLVKKVEANGLMELAKLDMSVMPYIDAMKTAGIKVNRKHMLDYGDQLKIEMRQLQEKLEHDLGIWINPSSSQQVAHVIYDMLGFPIEVRTKEGAPSTNDKVLEALAPLHPSITDITDYRELNKLRGTYALKLPRWTDEYHRVHPNWKTTRVPTGRLACADPNLMAIPIRSERGNAIRRGFIPEPGYVFVGVDLSQIEMRILAHLSRDPTLIDVFLSGKDIHSASAAAMWKCTIEEIDAEHFGGDSKDFIKRYGRPWWGPPTDPTKAGGASRRSSGKNVSFGIVYGVTATGLQAQVKSKTHQEWTEEQCQAMIDLWLESAYPHVKYYMERQKHLARRDGFVQTLMGRRRYVPGVNSSIPRIRGEANRQAINHPVQGSASEVIKVTERDIWNYALPMFRDAGVNVRPVLQIHDELVFECPTEAAHEWSAVVTDFMQRAVTLCVPIKADAHITAAGELGGSWADLK